MVATAATMQDSFEPITLLLSITCGVFLPSGVALLAWQPGWRQRYDRMLFSFDILLSIYTGGNSVYRN